MGVPSNSVRNSELLLLQQAEILALGLLGLRSLDPERAVQLSTEISERLENVARGDGAGAAVDPAISSERRKPVLISSKASGGDPIEDFILEILLDSPRGYSVQEIVEHLKVAELPIKRETLVVRLHRMERSGKLTSIAHGHYALSELERTRRQ